MRALCICLLLWLLPASSLALSSFDDPLDAMKKAIESNKQQAPPPVRRQWIAFSISERCLRDSCGDGHWGVGVSADRQSAINESANICAANSLRPNWCKADGNWSACRTDDKPSWAALALFDDGSEHTFHGEAVAFSNKLDAETNALRDCEINLHKCEIVWSQSITCPK